MENGVYAARPKAASVYESEKGALVLALVHALEGGVDIKSYHGLTTRDGAVNTRCVEDLKKWSGWDGCDPYWFMDTDLTGIAVELVVENEPGFSDASKLYPKVKWVNPPGGRRSRTRKGRCTPSSAKWGPSTNMRCRARSTPRSRSPRSSCRR